MSIISMFLFGICVFFSILGWRSAQYYFEMKDTKMGWTSIALSALNAASAASIIF